MKVVLDTNVLVSGIFFSGPPAAILDEYRRVSEELSGKFPDVAIQPIPDLVVVHSEVCDPPPMAQPVCEDPSDDKFLSAAIVTRTKIIVSGDKHLI